MNTFVPFYKKPFTGRVSQKTYRKGITKYILFSILIPILLGVSVYILFVFLGSTGWEVIVAPFAFIMSVPGIIALCILALWELFWQFFLLSITVRRMHDINISGKFILYFSILQTAVIVITSFIKIPGGETIESFINSPLLNIGALGILMKMPTRYGSNKYGNPPFETENPYYVTFSNDSNVQIITESPILQSTPTINTITPTFIEKPTTTETLNSIFKNM